MNTSLSHRTPRMNLRSPLARLILGLSLAVSSGVVVAVADAVVAIPTVAHAASAIDGPITRAEIISRAQFWLNKGIIYGSGNYPDPQGKGYRTDCSGYVSMAWHLGSSRVTYDDPIVGNLAAVSTRITKEQMQPGDMMMALGVGAAGHAVLFAGWADAAHTRYNAYDFGSTPVRYRSDSTGGAVPYPYFTDGRTFLPYRYNNITGADTAGSRLSFVKTRNTGSGWIELHELPTPFQSYDMHAATGFSAAESSLGTFAIVDGQLVYFKTRNTASGRVELHTRTPESGYQSGGDIATWFNVGDGSNGVFQLLPNGDIVFIKTRNTSTGKVEVHRISGADLWGPPVLSVATIVSSADAGNGTFQMSGNDLVFIKTRNTGTGKVEVHVADGGTTYSSWKLNTSSVFSTADGLNGLWSVRNIWTGGVGDLIFIKTRNTGTGTVELFGASASAGYQQMDMATPTGINGGDGANGTFTLT